MKQEKRGPVKLEEILKGGLSTKQLRKGLKEQVKKGRNLKNEQKAQLKYEQRTKHREQLVEQGRSRRRS